MAFNPFHRFRKHQKSIFAVLVIICMFVFILQSGMAGDFFTRALNWFGAGRGKGGPYVTTLYGTKVYENDLSQLQRQRVLANQFAFYVAFFGPQLTQGQQGQLRATNLPFFPPYWDQAGQFVRIFGGGPTGYFGGSLSNQGLLDFMAWRARADQSGIQLTEADLRRLLSREAGSTDIFGGKSFADSTLVQSVAANARSRVTSSELEKALLDEYRVLMAQEELLGEQLDGRRKDIHRQQLMAAGQANPLLAPQLHATAEQLRAAATPGVTPYESLQYYREQRTSLTVWMLPIDVEEFVARVKERGKKPSEKDLQRLFDKYRNEEPNPTRDRPAFKEPKRVKAAWLVANPDLPYFKEQARLNVTVQPTVAQVALPATAFFGGGCPAATLAQVGVPLALLDPALAEYLLYEQKQSAPTLTQDGANVLHDRSLTHPGALLFALGNALAAGANPVAGIGGLPGVPAAWEGCAAYYEEQETRRVLAADLSVLGLLAPANAGAGVVPPLGYGPGYAAPLRFLLGSPSPLRGVLPNVCSLPGVDAALKKTEGGGQPMCSAPFRSFLPNISSLPAIDAALKKTEGGVRPVYNAYAVVRPELIARLVARETDAVAGKEMDALKAELAKAKGNADEFRKKLDEALKKYQAPLRGVLPNLCSLLPELEAAVKKYEASLRGVLPNVSSLLPELGAAVKGVDAALTKYEPHLVAMPAALDQYDLAKDEGIKSFREAYKDRSKPDAMQGPFVDFLLGGSQRGLKATYEPQTFQHGNDFFLVWQTEKLEAREPRSLNEPGLRERVTEAWYLQEARALARQRADELSDEARRLKQEGKSAAVIRGRLQGEGKEGFTLFNVARLVSEAPLQGARGKEYRPYKPEESKIAYPRPNLADQLVKQLKDLGDSTVVSDLPERHYYVCVLETRDNRTNLAEFLELYSKAAADPLKGPEDLLWQGNLIPAKTKDFHKEVLRQLRIDSGAKLTESGDYDLPEDVRVRGGDTTGED